MKYSFDDIERAFEFVSSGDPMMNAAVLCKTTGRVYFDSGLGDSDTDFPDAPDNDDYFFIPHKNDFDLGSHLVVRYTNEVAPNLAAEIDEIFSRKGAYSRFRRLLQEKGMIDSWHKFEDAETCKALREWCHESGIELKDA